MLVQYGACLLVICVYGLKDVKADSGDDYHINCITMSKVLCLAVLAVMYTNSQVTPSDVFG